MVVPQFGIAFVGEHETTRFDEFYDIYGCVWYFFIELVWTSGYTMAVYFN